MQMKLELKRTEYGLTPQDWQIVPLSTLMQFQNGANAEKSAYGGGTPFVNVLEIITNSHLIRKDVPGRVSLSKSAISSYSVKYGDLLFNRTSETQSEVGLAAVYVDLTPIVFGGFVIRGRPSTDRLSARYAGYGLRALSVRKQIIARGQGAIRANIGQSDLRKVLVAIPPLAEQEAIAKALCDADALIKSLEQLAIKKRQVKQGAMQEFFRVEANERLCELGEISRIKGRIGWQGLKQSEFTENDDEPFLVTGMNFKDGAIRWSEVYRISWSRYEMAKDIQLVEGDVLLTKDGTIGKTLFIDSIPYPGKASLNSHLLVFRPINETYDPRYLYYQLQSARFKNFVELNKSGTTFFGLSQAAISKYPVVLPMMGEQRKIAATLTSIDAEIEALELKLGKMRQIKQGMMQELLTGRIRLI